MHFQAHETAVIDDGARIGDDTRIWHFTHIMADVIIGNQCVLGQNVFVANGVRIGNRVKIQNNVSLYTGVICEDEVFLGPSAVLTNVINPRGGIERKTEFRPTLIRRGATIGANATIVCGNEIGAYALVAAGSVVTHPVKAYALMIGVPARQAGWVSAYGHRLTFDPVSGLAQCPESGQQYRLENGEVTALQAGA